MKLFAVTITGLSDDNDLDEVFELSIRYPWLEWGVLLSESAMGWKPRYPSMGWVQQLKARLHQRGGPITHDFRFAAHLCGKTMRKFIPQMSNTYRSDGEPGWLDPYGLSEPEFNYMFKRTQINFNAARENIGAGALGEMTYGWYETFDGNFITQHNRNNWWVWEAIQREEVKSGCVRHHQILHDASGGTGKMLDGIPQPIAGVLNGYAGGINPGNVFDVLRALEENVSNGYLWIDMESGVRTEADLMNMSAIHHMLKEIAMVGEERNWF